MALLKFYVKHGLLEMKGSERSFYMKATSGEGNCMNNPSCSDQSWLGPIPRGKYYAYGGELTDKCLAWDFARTARHGVDFGDWRIPLHADRSNYSSRSGFFIHCGKKLGSAGCIDVGGGFTGNTQTDTLKAILQKSIKSTVWVI